MKAILLTVLALVGTSSFAGEPGSEILKLYKDNGSVSPELRETFTCRIFPGSVEITYTNASGLSLSQNKSIQLEGADEIIKNAVTEPVEELQPAPVGSGAMDYSAFYMNQYGDREEVVLYSNSQLRKGRWTQTLLPMMSQLCRF